MPKAKATKSKPAAKPAPKAAAPAKPERAARPAAARLGDDLGGAAPRLSREPVSLIVARTDIVGGQVRMALNGKGGLTVARGQVVHVKHPYRLQEHSTEREEYRVLLKSSLDGKPHAPALARIGDQWGVPEDINGYLQHEYTFATPGLHTVEFEVGAEYCVMSWGKTEAQHLDRKDMKGRVDVVVV